MRKPWKILLLHVLLFDILPTWHIAGWDFCLYNLSCLKDFQVFFFVPEKTNLKTTYAYIMNSKDSCLYHSFFFFRFWASAGFGINRGCLFCAHDFLFYHFK